MRSIIAAVVFLAFLAGSLFPQSAQEKAAMIVQPAIVNLEATQSFSVKLNTALFGYPELEGRTYRITEKKKGAGFLINGDGYLFSPSSIIPQSNDTIFLSNLATAIADDAGRIQHIKMFGSEPDVQELSAFSEYLSGLNGGKDGLSAAILSAINSGSISVVLDGNPSLSAFFNDSGSETLVFINETDGLVFAKADGKNFLTLGLSNDSGIPPDISNGDTVYIATFNGSDISITPAVATVASSVPAPSSASSSSPTSVSSSLNFPKNYFPPYLPGIVFDSSSRLLGVSSGGSVIPSSEVVRASINAGISPSKSEADGSYQQGMAALWSGDSQMAEFFLEDVIADNPKQSGGVSKYLGSARSAGLEVKIPNIVLPGMSEISPQVMLAILAVAILAGLFLIVKFLVGRSRRTH